MIVVDANVIIYWATEGPLTHCVEQLRRRDPDWRTTPLWRYEFTNAVVMMMRARILNEAKALDALTKAEALMTPREHSAAQSDIVRTANHHGISAYDAQYIALAQLLGVRCVTNDAGLSRKTPGISLRLSDIDRLQHP